ncbi:hypothetical protein MC885_001942, partial [Smutsia gigantea]
MAPAPGSPGPSGARPHHAARPTRRRVGFSKPPPSSPPALTALRSRTPSLASCSSDTNLVEEEPGGGVRGAGAGRGAAPLLAGCPREGQPLQQRARREKKDFSGAETHCPPWPSVPEKLVGPFARRGAVASGHWSLVGFCCLPYSSFRILCEHFSGLDR